jgi:hypothetical protein
MQLIELLLTGRRRFGSRQALLPLILSQESFDSRVGEKNWCALQFFFPNRERSSPVDTAQKDSGARAARKSETD